MNTVNQRCVFRFWELFSEQGCELVQLLQTMYFIGIDWKSFNRQIVGCACCYFPKKGTVKTLPRILLLQILFRYIDIYSTIWCFTYFPHSKNIKNATQTETQTFIKDRQLEAGNPRHPPGASLFRVECYCGQRYAQQGTLGGHIGHDPGLGVPKMFGLKNLQNLGQ